MDNVLCDPCGHSGFLSCKREVELTDLRTKLAAAEAHGEQYRKNWLSLQYLTGEQCLDRARYAVKAWKEAAEQLAAATERAEKAEQSQFAAETDRDYWRDRWNAAMEEGKKAAGHEWGLWTTGAAVAVASLKARAEAAEARLRHLEMTNVVPMQNAINDAVRAQEAAEAERDEWRTKALDVEKHPVVVALVEERDALRNEAADLRQQIRQERQAHQNRADDFEADRDAIASQNAALRAALEWQREALDCGYYHYPNGQVSCSDCGQEATEQSAIQHTDECAFGHIERALSLTPPDAVAAAREREAGLSALVERLRVVVERELDDLMQTYPTYGIGGGSIAEERDQAEWETVNGERKKRLRAALSLTPPSALEALRRKLIGEESDRWITALRKLDLGLCDFIDEGDIDARLADWLEALRRREREAALREARQKMHRKQTWEEVANMLTDMADAIATERDHIADAGKKVEGGA